MISLTAAVLASLLNLAFAANVYLSLSGWLVAYEPSGMQLLFHLVLTAPAVAATTLWLYLLSRAGKCSPWFWKVNALGLAIPTISLQTGVAYHGYDKLGLLVILLVSLSLVVLYVARLRQYARS